MSSVYRFHITLATTATFCTTPAYYTAYNTDSCCCKVTPEEQAALEAQWLLNQWERMAKKMTPLVRSDLQDDHPA